jgi:hypothetical protein
VSKEDILTEFEIEFEKTASDKNGEYLFINISKKAKKLIAKDRPGIIDVCKEWLSLRKEPYTLLAVDIIKNLKISELRPELIQLKKDIESGRTFQLFYVGLINLAIKAIS